MFILKSQGGFKTDYADCWISRCPIQPTALAVDQTFMMAQEQ